MEEHRKGRCSEPELRRESGLDAISKIDGNNFGTEVRESHATVYQLTHKILKLQEVVGLPTIQVDHSFFPSFSESGSLR